MTATKSNIATAAAASVVTAAILCFVFLLAWTLGATTTQSNALDHSRFVLTADSVSDHFRMKGNWECYLEGEFAGASVTMAKLKDSVTTPVTKDVNLGVFVNATMDVDFTGGLFGIGHYRWQVTGGDVTFTTAIEADCADAN